MGDGPHRVTWLGHSTVLVELDGVRVLTDPVLRRRVVHLRREHVVDPEPLADVDAVVVSHVHFDHLDVASLRQLGRDVPLFVPRGAGRMLRRRAFGRVVELEPGATVELGSVLLRAVHAEHDASRGPLGVRVPSLGYVVEGTHAVYFAGDTDLFESMHGFGELDAALLPISGWGPRVGPGHLDPARAAEALRRLQPRVAVPIHWGTFTPMLQGRSSARPAEHFVEHAARLAPEVDVKVLPVGGTLEL